VEEWLKSHNVYRYARRCHPWSCLKPSMRGKHVLLNIRDPVDRFISAFDWAKVRVCSPDDKRRMSSHGGPGIIPWYRHDKWCLKDPSIQHVLYGKYHGDANLLAADLCSKDSKVKKSARAFLHYKLRHGYTLRSRLRAKSHSAARRFLKHNKVYFVVIEEGFDFMAQMPDVAFELLRGALGKKRAKHLVMGSGSVADTHRHSSKELKGPPTKLTDKSMRCIAKVYAKDYKLINLFKESCRGRAKYKGTCRRALEHILVRRKKLMS